ncbi:MAG TPA: hypothetical protein VN521_07120 [Negativicutes bacterium]|nr:hypothetical protein [Negativicutes bacterium]
MAKLFSSLLIFLALLAPVPASAAGFSVNVAVSRQDDGTLSGELWYNDQVIWRLRIVGEGVRPVAGQAGGGTTVVVPDIDKGLFQLKVYNQ